jgi:hypothetical protein
MRTGVTDERCSARSRWASKTALNHVSDRLKVSLLSIHDEFLSVRRRACHIRLQAAGSDARIQDQLLWTSFVFKGIEVAVKGDDAFACGISVYKGLGFLSEAHAVLGTSRAGIVSRGHGRTCVLCSLTLELSCPRRRAA